MAGVFVIINGITGNQQDNQKTLVYCDFVGGLTTAGIMATQHLWQFNNMSVVINNYTTPKDLAQALISN